MQKDDIDKILGDGKSENEYESTEIPDNWGSAEEQADENWDATLKIE